MRCYSHLSDDEREQIGLAKAVGHSIGAIAKAIGRPKSTVSRELSRNKLPSGRYSPLHAAGAYQLRRRREALIERDRALRTFVVDRLAEGWTPEQISGWLKGGNAAKALDRILLWNNYVVPQWSFNKLRTARWDRFSHPDPWPKYGISAFPALWWWDADKAAKTGSY